jgi:hypothetical protein
MVRVLPESGDAGRKRWCTKLSSGLFDASCERMVAVAGEGDQGHPGTLLHEELTGDRSVNQMSSTNAARQSPEGPRNVPMCQVSGCSTRVKACRATKIARHVGSAEDCRRGSLARARPSVREPRAAAGRFCSGRSVLPESPERDASNREVRHLNPIGARWTLPWSAKRRPMSTTAALSSKGVRFDAASFLRG